MHVWAIAGSQRLQHGRPPGKAILGVFSSSWTSGRGLGLAPHLKLQAAGSVCKKSPLLGSGVRSAWQIHSHPSL